MKRYLILSILLLVPFLMVGCSSKKESPESPLDPTLVATPLKENTHLDSPLASSAPAITPSPEIVLKPGLGVVKGILVWTDDSWSLDGRLIYLSGVIHPEGAEEDFEVVGISPTTDPSAVVAADGSFTFIDIEPGKYALSTISPRGSQILLLGADTKTEIVVKVKASEITDLDIVHIKLVQ